MLYAGSLCDSLHCCSWPAAACGFWRYMGAMSYVHNTNTNIGDKYPSSEINKVKEYEVKPQITHIYSTLSCMKATYRHKRILKYLKMQTGKTQATSCSKEKKCQQYKHHRAQVKLMRKLETIQVILN